MSSGTAYTTDVGLGLGGTSRSEVGDRPLSSHRGHDSDPWLLKRAPRLLPTEPGLSRRTADNHA
eukprot:scaffold30339_cov60-Phaeocystis_antarctica.AAC.2